MKLQPRQFRVNEAWILFQLSREPIITERDGPAICFALMDAASCFVLNARFFPGTDARVLSKNAIRDLLKSGWEHKKAYPEKLIVANGLLSPEIEAQAQAQGINAEGVDESDLKSIIGEAQREFRARFA